MPQLSNTEKMMRELIKLTDQSTTKYNLRLVKAYKTALAQTRDEIFQVYLKYGKSKRFVLAADKLANLEKNIAAAIIDLTGETVDTIRSGTSRIHEINFKGTNKIFAEFGVVNRRAVNASVVNPMRWENATNTYNVALLRGIKEIISVGMITGESFDALLTKVTDKFNISATRAMRILRTEIHRNENLAKLQSIDANIEYAKSLGLDVNKFWISVIDGRTRDSHIEMDGKSADPITGFFTFPSGNTTLAPGNSGIAEEDINCRCELIMDFNTTKNNEQVI